MGGGVLLQLPEPCRLLHSERPILRLQDPALPLLVVDETCWLKMLPQALTQAEANCEISRKGWCPAVASWEGVRHWAVLGLALTRKLAWRGHQGTPQGSHPGSAQPAHLPPPGSGSSGNRTGVFPLLPSGQNLQLGPEVFEDEHPCCCQEQEMGQAPQLSYPGVPPEHRGPGTQGSAVADTASRIQPVSTGSLMGVHS